MVDEYRTARGRYAGTASRVARRAFSAQASSIAANVRSSGGRTTGATSTRAPARRNERASSASASRNPAVPPSDTIRTSARGIGLAFWRAMEIAVLPETLAVCRLRASERIPSWALELHEGFVSITRTPDELSIVCPEEAVPPDTQVEEGWRALVLPGPIPFEQTGVLASIATPLAAAGISIFAVSTYDTDYVLVRAGDLERALEALQPAPARLRISSGSPYEPVIGFSRARPDRRPRARLRHRAGHARRRLPGVDRRPGPPRLGDRRGRARRGRRLRGRRRPHPHASSRRRPTPRAR